MRAAERAPQAVLDALRTGASGILFTCSAFGPCIDTVRRRWPDVPVLKPNEAIIDDAVRIEGSGEPGAVDLIEPSYEEYAGALRLHSFYVRYRLPIMVETQHFEYLL